MTQAHTKRDAGPSTSFLMSAGMGAIAGATSKTIVAPVERIRLLVQMANSPSEGGMSSGVRSVLQREGMRGFWRGNGLSVTRATLQKGLLFSTQDWMRSVLGSDMLAGGLAGMTASGLTYPLDLLRTRHAGHIGSSSLFAVARQAAFQSGPLALWQGASATLAGGILYEGMRFGLYGQLRQVDNGASAHRFGPATCGAVASLLAGNVIYPNDTVRRRLQTVSGSGETYMQVCCIDRSSASRRGCSSSLLRRPIIDAGGLATAAHARIAAMQLGCAPDCSHAARL